MIESQAGPTHDPLRASNQASRVLYSSLADTATPSLLREVTPCGPAEGWWALVVRCVQETVPPILRQPLLTGVP